MTIAAPKANLRFWWARKSDYPSILLFVDFFYFFDWKWAFRLFEITISIGHFVRNLKSLSQCFLREIQCKIVWAVTLFLSWELTACTWRLAFLLWRLLLRIVDLIKNVLCLESIWAEVDIGVISKFFWRAPGRWRCWETAVTAHKLSLALRVVEWNRQIVFSAQW